MTLNLQINQFYVAFRTPNELIDLNQVKTYPDTGYWQLSTNKEFTMRKYNNTLLIVAISFLVSGCASQQDFRALRTDVDALQAQVQLIGSEAKQALRNSNQLMEQTEAARKASEKASADAAATREMLENINSRIGNDSNNSAFK